MRLHPAAIPANPFASRTIAIAFGAAFFLSALPHHNQNDFMYVVAPTLFEPQALYQDLPFVQTPLSIFLYNFIYILVPESEYYLILRVVSVTLTVFTGVLVYKTMNSIAGTATATAALILFFTCHYVSIIAWEVGNYSLASALLFMATYRYFGKFHSLFNCALIGFFIGLAATAKLNFAVYSIGFGIFLAIRNGFFSKPVIYYIFGGILGSSLLWIYVFKEFSSFFFFNIEFHYLVNVFRGFNTEDSVLRMVQKLFAFLKFMLVPIGLSVFAVVILRNQSGARERNEIAVLAVISFFAAISPGYLAEQYLAPLAVFICMLASFVLVQLFEEVRIAKFYSWALFMVCSIPLFFVTAMTASFVANNKSVPINVVRVRENIETVAQHHLLGTNCPRTVVSLSAIPLIGTSFDISKLSATGPFVPQLEALLRKHAPEFHKYANLAEEFERDPPTALLLGYFRRNPAEKKLRAYVSSRPYIRFPVGELSYGIDMELFVRAACIDKGAIGH